MMDFGIIPSDHKKIFMWIIFSYSSTCGDKSDHQKFPSNQLYTKITYSNHLTSVTKSQTQYGVH